MRRALITRLFSATLILLIGGGGGGLAVMDGLFFHSRERGPEAPQAHFEANAGCHADGCAIRSTAHHTRLAAAIGTTPLVIHAPQVSPSERVGPSLHAGTLYHQPLSRAPPLSD